MHSDKPLELGHKVRVIHLGQLPADVNGEHFPAVVFIELNRHSVGFVDLLKVNAIPARDILVETSFHS